MSKNIKELVISLYKIVFTLLIAIIFFVGFSFKYSALLVPSRSLAVTIISFVISYVLFSKIYGSLQIGEYKSKPVIYSTSLVVFFTDCIAYLSLMVMVTNPNNISANPTFRLDYIGILALIFLIQFIVVVVSTYFGNYIYFQMFEPLITLVLKDSDYCPDEHIEHYLNRYKKQYTMYKVLDVRSDEINSAIHNSTFIIFTEMSAELRKNLVEVCYLQGINFAFCPNVSDVVEMSGRHLTYGDKPVVEVQVSSLSFNQRFMKRCIDILFSSIGVIISSPFWLIFFIAIKLDDGGPLFFKQLRKTLNGREFEVYKFRTMKVNSLNYSATENDDRITRVGKFLRKIRMDELPQLINILNGDMSIVGPRPEMLENIKKYEDEMPEFSYRLKVKAGLTGIAQIEGKYNTTPKDKLIFDLIYIENYSIWMDIKLMFKTIIVFFKSDSTEGF